MGEAIALNHNQSMKYSLQRAWRMPNAAELFINGVHHGTFRHEQGNAQLNPEVAYMLDVAYEFQAEKVNVSVAGYAHYFSKDRKSTRLNSSHEWISRMPSSA